MKIKFLIHFLFMLGFIACNREKIKEPYNPNFHTHTMTADINGYVFEREKITISVSENNNSFIGVVGKDSLFTVNVGFPEDCGEKTFIFPNSNLNVFLFLNNTECTSGILEIKKYDTNLVEGNFQFKLETDSLINVSNGKFSIVYDVNH